MGSEREQNVCQKRYLSGRINRRIADYICLLCSERTDLHIAVLVILYTTRANLFMRNFSKSRV